MQAPVTTGLQLAPDVWLPLDLVTEIIAILAQRGAGKTYLGLKFTEQMIKAGEQVIVFDPLGVWWGLRTSADGTQPGLPVAIFGGKYGDIAVSASDGAAVAKALVNSRRSAVLDLSHLSKPDRLQFAADCAEALFARTDRTPLHIVLDEADMFAPQTPSRRETALLDVMDDIARRGRVLGLGMTLITQRSAVINKNLISQASVLIALRTTAPNDKDAIDAWIKGNGTSEQRQAVLGALSGLPTGTAFIVSPYYGIFERVEIGVRETYDSSSTPKVGQRPLIPITTGEIDLDELLAQFENAEAPKPEAPDDPDLADLRRQKALLEQRVADLSGQANTVEQRLNEGYALIAEMNTLVGRINDLLTGTRRTLLVAQVDTTTRPVAERSVETSSTDQSPNLDNLKGYDGGLSTQSKKILGVLARHHPARLTLTQVATLAGYEKSGGAWRGGLKQLRESLLIDIDRDSVFLNRFGIALMDVGERYGLNATELRAIWLKAINTQAAKLLTSLFDRYPNTVSYDALAAALGYQRSGGAWRGGLKQLRDNDLVEINGDQIRAADMFFQMPEMPR